MSLQAVLTFVQLKGSTAMFNFAHLGFKGIDYALRRF